MITFYLRLINMIKGGSRVFSAVGPMPGPEAINRMAQTVIQQAHVKGEPVSIQAFVFSVFPATIFRVQ